MRKRRTPGRWRDCRSKERYEHEHAAARAIGRLVMRGRVQVGELHCYSCSACNGFHIGHPRAKDKRLG